ncbi:hypothetical protein Q7634_29750 (plasmid) [Klebsiella pneumoniae]|nr:MULTISPECIES: hypothetical protein [Enterobacteriaceae]BBR80960.1 hypothetical protein WP4S18C04_P50020 [Klebsiella pneumoniae]GKI50104.1 hypothetical protein NUBL2888_49490 [Klebsiella pneumoniae]
MNTETKKLTLDELLAQCNPDTGMSDEDRQWVNQPPAGDEIA